jgi:hypothetical protein
MGGLAKIKKDCEDLLKAPKLRPWRKVLASLAAALGASFAMTSAVPASTSTAPSTQVPPALTREIRRSKGTPTLILRSGAQLTRLAQHESHESHSSHESHESHYSGQ